MVDMGRESSNITYKPKTFRKKLRTFCDNPLTEVSIMGVVFMYAIIIFIDLGFKNESYSWMFAFFIIDVILLTFFMVELLIRLYAFGFKYLKDWLNAIDACVVVVSFIFLWTFHPVIASNGGLGSAAGVSGITRLIRLVRLFRLLTVMNKIQRSRASANMMRKKAKYRRVGSPVERVLEILQKLKNVLDNETDRDNINFIMDVIVSDQLYVVNISSNSADGGVSAEMSAFLGRQGVTNVTRKAAQTSLNQDDEGTDSGATAHLVGDDGNVVPARKCRRRSAELKGDDVTSWVEKLLEGDEVKAALSNAHSWDFNMFQFDKLLGKHTMVVLCMHFIQYLKLDEQLNIHSANLVRFLTKLQSGYKEVPFHTYVHACDVVHGTVYFMTQAMIKPHVGALDMYAMILGAAMHDHNHPGVNNAFCITARDEMAVMYNDVSVLENHHISSAWQIMQTEGFDPFEGFSTEQYLDVRQTMVQTILGTDMKYHFEHLAKFKTRASTDAFVAPDRNDTRLLLTMCLHAADVSNPCKEWSLCVVWAGRVMTEFFNQGDKEVELGLPVSPFMDRTKTNIAQCQVGFVSILIKPFFEEWTGFLGEKATKDCVGNVTANVAKWEADGEEALGDALDSVKYKKKEEPAPAPAAVVETTKPPLVTQPSTKKR